MELTAAQRSYETSVRLWRGGSGPGAFPGKSAHNYGAAIDINITLPNGTTKLIKADSPALWEVTGIPELAREAGLYWAGHERLGDGQFDTVHFMSTSFDYKQTYQEIINYLDFNKNRTDFLGNLTEAEKDEISRVSLGQTDQPV